VKSALETLSPTRVKMTVEVPFAELKPSLDAAFKHIGEHIQVPGFRKGKVPSRIIEQRVGRAAVLEEAVNSALPQFYGQALEEHAVRPLGQPEISDLNVPAVDGDDFSFIVEVDKRPEIDLPDFSDIELTVDEVTVEDADVEDRLDALRARFGSLVGVDRAVEDGDFVSIDLAAEIDGEQIDSVTGVSYEVGSGNMLEGLDEALVGMSADETKEFTAALAGGDRAGDEAHCTVTVTAVKERELPELDDEFAQLASEFDTLEELKADSRKRLENMKQYDQATQAQERVLEKLLELVEVPVPEKLLEDEINTRKHNLEHHQLGQMGLDLEKYLEIQGKTVEEFEAETKEAAVKGIKTQFVLDELVKQEKLNVNQEELTEHLMRRAASSGMSPDQFAQAVVEGGQVPLLVGEVARGKALAVVVEAATVKDTNGEVIDLDDEDEVETAAEVAAEATEADATEADEEKTEG